MSRNSRRTSANPPTPQAPAPPRGLPTQNNENPFGISFVVPTEVVSLPTKGKFYDKNSSLCGRETLEIKHLTAKEEDLLANQSFIEDGTIFDRLLSAILIDRSVNVSELIETDKNALLIASRITGYGSEYSMRMPCQACGKVAEFVFDLEKREIEDSIPEGVSFEEDTGLFVFILPKTELEAKVRILNGNDLQYLDKQNDDLEEALSTLESAIRKIDKETRSRFKETYDLVNISFLIKVRFGSVTILNTPNLLFHQNKGRKK